MDSKKRKYWIVLISALVLYAYGCVRLFYNFVTGKQFSDFGAHIVEAVEGTGYSMAHILLKICYNSGHGDILISVMMTLVVVLTVLAVAYFVKSYLKDGYAIRSNWFTFIIIGISATLITQIYLPYVYPHFYVHDTTLAPNLHNTTFLFMRLFGWITLSIYFYLSDHYLEAGNWWLYILFTVSLILVNFSKPNFILGFAPAMLIVLIYDYIRSHKKESVKTYLYIIRFGTCVLLSLPIVLVQASKVYDDGSTISFTIYELYLLIRNPLNLIIVLFTNLGFPILAYVFVRFIVPEKIELRKFNQAWLMYVISYAQKLFMVETGGRGDHGNYAWGSYFFCCVLHVVALIEIIKIQRQKLAKEGVCWGIISLYLLEVISGVAFFIYFVMGGNYSI